MAVREMFLAATCIAAVSPVMAAPPSKNDYASGMTIEAFYAQPMIEAVLPEEVYRTVTRDDLGDLRVFNVEGQPVPHAICPASQTVDSEIEPVWFNAALMQSNEADVLLFDAAHLAPVSYGRLRLPQENSFASVAIQSRKDQDSPWRTRWRGDSYVIVADTKRRESPPARFAATTDRYWRAQILNDAPAEGIGLELGYHPARVRFLAQGAGPFTLAFGSRRAEPARPARCDGLLSDVSGADRERLIEAGSLGPVVSLGGNAVLQPPPKKTPVKVVVLWAVLVVGVALLVAMALSLLKRVRKPGS